MPIVFVIATDWTMHTAVRAELRELGIDALVLLCYKQSQAPSVTKRAGGELLDKMFSNLNS
jgi:hypothetical protein